MADAPSDTGLRRAPLGAGNPPAGTQLGADTIRAPLKVERGLVHGTSNRDAGEGHLALEEDIAEGKTTSSKGGLPATPSPFVLTK